MKGNEMEISQSIDLFCPVCRNQGLVIDMCGWLHCSGCCSLSPEAFERLTRLNTPRVLMEKQVEKAVEKAEQIAAEYGFTMTDVRGQMRHPKISTCRQRIFYELREDGLSFNQIAHICNKDHSSVIYGWKRAVDVLKGIAA